jgi:hypothetical protein
VDFDRTRSYGEQVNQEPTVNAGDIARLLDVGRAAVSNWRRRHDDFPQPVGGTASSPLFLLREVEDWLWRNGKPIHIPQADRVWQRLRAAADDLHLGRAVAWAGAYLVCQHAGPDAADALPGDVDRDWGTPQLRDQLADLAAERGPRGAFEFLCARYAEAHSRQLAVTPPDLARALHALVGVPGGTVLDPACGLGGLLLAGEPARALGQDVNPDSAAIAAARLRLRGVEVAIAPGDTLRADAHPDELADAVLCDPPFNERAWGHEELAGDPRWEYGLPPRGESELAWVQHCLARLRPGGHAAVLMPAAAATRRPGRRIRSNLLRAGALRGVVTLGPTSPDVWLLRRPEPADRPAAHLLVLDLAGDLGQLEPAWRAFQDGRTDHAVPVVDLLDEDVDVSPARWRQPRSATAGVEFARALAEYQASTPVLPDLAVLPDPAALPTTTLGELAKSGLLTIRHAPAKLPEPGQQPVLTADDLAHGRPATGRAADDPEQQVDLAPGDVVASPAGMARVITSDDTVLGPGLTRFRVDPHRLDPHFLAGVLRAGTPPARPGSTRLDVRRTAVPRLPLADQRAYGQAFQQLADLADTVRRTAELGDRLVRLGFAGLVDGNLRPQD